jgi:hypothetical protein
VSERDRKDAAYHYDITNYLKPSEGNKKTHLIMPTTSADIAETKHYESSLLNFDISGTGIPVPL